MTAEIEQILPILVRGKVDFILVGGMAAILHGSARVTFDVDVVYDRSPANIRRLIAALEPYSPYLRGAPPGLPFSLDEHTVRKGLNFTLTTQVGDLDLFGEIAGAGAYRDVLPYADETEAFGVNFLCVGLDRLIHMKRAARRPKDLEAIAELSVILEEEQHATRSTEGMDVRKLLISAIENRAVIRFIYNGRQRIVEPQTYGVSTTGNELLRAYQREGGSKSADASPFRLFEVAKLARLEITSEQFAGARAEHNPHDGAMSEIFATLPKR